MAREGEKQRGMAEEEEVSWELEALQAVYSGDCSVLRRHPPLLHLRLIPRTADLTSQQFVEATIQIRAGPNYPKEPPEICVVDSKGIDSQRQNLLLDYVRLTASQLSSSSMLVAVCEEAVERLSLMNHPDGDCPLCLYPLVHQHNNNNKNKRNIPFMKLMSCFHCFHCDCIIRWWNYLQDNNNSNHTSPTNTGNCPVCRKEFHAKDFEHVRHLVASSDDHDEVEFQQDAEKLLSSDSERARREKFEAALKLQQDNSGVIEPKTHVSVPPETYLPLPTLTPTPATTSTNDTVPATPTPTPTAATTSTDDTIPATPTPTPAIACTNDTVPATPTPTPTPTTTSTDDTIVATEVDNASSSLNQQRKAGTRKPRPYNRPRRNVNRQWIRKQHTTS